MANSLLGLNTENPVTSSRIKYTHTQTEASPRGNVFKPKHKTPHRRRKARRDPRAWAFLCLSPLAQRGPAAGAGARWDNPKTHRFVFKPQEKQAGTGEGKGRREPSGRGNGEGTKTTGRSVRAPLGHRGKRLPKPQWRLPAGTQPAPFAGTPSAARPRCCARTRDGRGDPECSRRLELSGARGRAGGPIPSAAAACACGSRPKCLIPPRCPNPRLAGRSASFGKGLATIPACFHAALAGEAPRPQKTCFLPASGLAAAGYSRGSQRRSGVAGRPTEPSRPACLPPRPGGPASPRLFAGHSPGPPFPPLRGWAGGASGKQCSGSRHDLRLSRGLPQQPE